MPTLNGKEVFSLARTKNTGIIKARSLAKDPATPIIVSDIDIWFSPETWAYLAHATTPLRALVPVYIMAANWEEREQKNHRDLGATGTIALTAANWATIRYDSRYIGYGAEDGKILQDLRQQGFHIDRKTTVYHIAHTRDSNQRNFKGRQDYHNPDFNPFRLSENASFAHSPTPTEQDTVPNIYTAPIMWPQFIGFELVRACNRATEHTACPSGDSDRYGGLDQSHKLDDATVLTAVKFAHDNGFTGHIVWHYYNEPLLAWSRTKALMLRIRQDTPAAKFTLWSNGDLIRRPWPELDSDPGAALRKSNGVDPEDLSLFDTCWISNYAKINWRFLTCHILTVHILDGNLDNRKLYMPANRRRCLRPFNELIIDHYGNAHLCCADWQGSTNLGNVYTNGYPSVVAAYVKVRDRVAKNPMPDGVPQLCLTCPIRSSQLGVLVPEMVADQQRYIDGL